MVGGVGTRIQEAQTGQRTQNAIIVDELIRTAALQAAGGGVEARVRRVGFHRVVQVGRAGADVANVQRHVKRQAALNVEAPLIHHRLEVVLVQHVGADGGAAVDHAKRIGERQRIVGVHQPVVGGVVVEVRAARERRIQVQNRVVVQLVNVVVNPVAGADHPGVAGAIRQADAWHEHVLLRGIEVVLGTDVAGDIGVGAALQLSATPQAANVLGHGVVFPAHADVHGQLLAHLPVVVHVEARAVLQHVGQRQAFRRIRRARQAQHELREAVAGDVPGKGEGAARNVSRAAEQSDVAILTANLHIVTAEAQVQAGADLVQFVVVEAVAAVALGQALQAVGETDRGQASFPLGQRTVAIVHNTEAVHADRRQVEVRIGTRVEAVVFGTGVAVASFQHSGRRENVNPLGGDVVVAAQDEVGELR